MILAVRFFLEEIVRKPRASGDDPEFAGLMLKLPS